MDQSGTNTAELRNVKNPSQKEIDTLNFPCVIQGDDNMLHRYLRVQQPDDPSKASPILSFRRRREVDIPWEEILPHNETLNNYAVKAIREYFEKSWNFTETNKLEDWFKNGNKLLADNNSSNNDFWFIKEIEKGESPFFSAQFESVPSPIDHGFVIHHGSGRLYSLVDSNENPLDKTDFQAYDKYNNAWDDKILGIELVFENESDSKFYMDIEEIDLRPTYLLSQYENLKIYKELAGKIKVNVTDRLNSIIDNIDPLTFSADELDQLQHKVHSLEISAFNIDRQIKRLAANAQRMGYFLCTQSQALTADELAAKIKSYLATVSPTVKPQDVAGEINKALGSTPNALSELIATIEQEENTKIENLIKELKSLISKPTDEPKIFEAIEKVADAEAKKISEIEKAREFFKNKGTDSFTETGKLYTIYERMAKWNYTVHFTHAKRKGFKIKRTSTTNSYSEEKMVKAYEEVDACKDFLEEKRLALVKEGFQVFIFKKTPEGFVSIEGVSLSQIMARCNNDDAFRLKCAVLLPVYEESMDGQRMLTKYIIFKRPLPGIVPVINPRLSLEESLSYRTAWLQTQLGELVNTINMAPGEERTISITKNYEQESTVSRTSASIFDITTTESSDLASEMENQVRHEQESSKSMEFSTKASGEYGGFSAQASASGGVKSSLKDFNHEINKIARKSAQAISNHNKNELSFSSMARTKIGTTDVTTAKINNINPGRSLNLFFYRLYNKYVGGLYLENLRFNVIPSVEVIAGSGVFEAKSYSLDQFDRVIDTLKSAQPFKVENDDCYTNLLIDSIKMLLSEEYITPPGGKLNSNLIFESENFPKNDNILDPDLHNGENRKTSQQKSEELRIALKSAIIKGNTPISRQELLVMTPGFYLDAVVGAQPCTEPYSENMRTQEVRMRQAEVFLKESEGFANQAKAAMQLCGQLNDNRTCITGLLPGPDKQSLSISLNLPLKEGEWCLLFDGKENGAKIRFQSQYIIVFSWEQPQNWLLQDFILPKLKLWNKTSNVMISCS